MDAIFAKMDVVDQLRARAFMLAQQSPDGIGIDFIENALLPCFDGTMPSQPRREYKDMDPDQRTALHRTVKQSYEAWFQTKDNAPPST